jgi:hypothetical protein
MKSLKGKRTILQDGTVKYFSYAFLVLDLFNIPMPLGVLLLQTRIIFLDSYPNEKSEKPTEFCNN